MSVGTEKKVVFISMSADIVHYGHLNILEEAKKLGDIVIGLHTDEVISSYWRAPILNYEERKKIVENMKNVVEVIPQHSLDQLPLLLKVKPDYVIHGEDWKVKPLQAYKERVLEAVKTWGAQIIEVPFKARSTINQLTLALSERGITPDMRLRKLRSAIASQKIVRILEAHNGLTGLIVENVNVEVEGKVKHFDGLWLSSLCDSTAKGMPDIELVDLTSRIRTINDVLEVTTKPIIFDGDTGGLVEHFVYMVKRIERLGVSAIIIEDKMGLKKNSLLGTDAVQEQDSIENFCRKIRAGREARVTKDFMVIARIESLIAGRGHDDAMARAIAYSEAGADGIMIHSRDKSGLDIKKFCQEFRKINNVVPIIVVPSTYNQITEDELVEWGVNVVIYANHLIRSAYPVMCNTAKSILTHGRAKEADKEYCMSIKEILELIPGTK